MKNAKILKTVLVLLLAQLVQADHVFQIIYFQKPAEVSGTIHLYANGVYLKEVKLQDRVFTKNIKVESKSTEDLVLHFTDKQLPEDIVGGLEGYPSLTVPVSYKKFVIIGNTNSKNKLLPIKFNPIDVTSGFDNGDFRFVNLLNQPITGSVGTAEIKIRPKKIETYRNFATPGEAYRLSISAHYKDRKYDKKTITHKLLRYSKNYRLIFFVFEPEGSTTARYQAAPIFSL